MKRSSKDFINAILADKPITVEQFMKELESESFSAYLDGLAEKMKKLRGIKPGSNVVNQQQAQ